MRFSATLASALLAPMLVSAAPVRRAANPSDVLVLRKLEALADLLATIFTCICRICTRFGAVGDAILPASFAEVCCARLH